MGAVTAILYSEVNIFKRQAHISCIILDSPFSTVSTMVEDVAKSKMGLPAFIISIGMSVIKGTIKSKINFDITKLDPLKSSQKLLIPAAFISAKADELVLPKRIQEYFKNYRHPNKRIIHSEYEHNSDREDEVLRQSYEFIENVLISETDKDIEGFGEDSNAMPQGRKISEDDRYARAKSRDMDYHLEGGEREKLALFFNNMELMRDEPPKSLNRNNVSIFDDDDEPNELDFEARERLVRLTGQTSHNNSTSIGNYNPIQIHSIRPGNTISQICQPIQSSSKITIIGRSNNPSTAMVTPKSSSGSSNSKIEVLTPPADNSNPSLARSPIPAYIVQLNDSANYTLKHRSKSAAPTSPRIAPAPLIARQHDVDPHRHATKITLTKRHRSPDAVLDMSIVV